MSIQEYIETHNLSKRVEETINAAVKAKAPEPISFMVGRARACRVGFRRLRRDCFFFLRGMFPFFFALLWWWCVLEEGIFSRERKKKRRPTRGRWRDDDDDKKETFAFSRNSRKGKESSRTNGVGLVGSRSRARRRRREEGVGLIPLFF